MTQRPGFALITILWVITALAALITVGLGRARLSLGASENRQLDRRAWWAAQACLAIAQGHYGRYGTMAVDSTPTGTSTWCQVHREPTTERVHLGNVDSLGMARTLGSDVLAGHYVDWVDADTTTWNGESEAAWYRAEGRTLPPNQRVGSVADLLNVRGFENVPLAWLENTFTTRGSAQLDPNRSSADVLRSLSMLPSGAADRAAQARTDRGFLQAEEFANATGVNLSAEAYQALTAALVFQPSQHILRVDGVARSGTRVTVRSLWASITALPDRLAVRRIEVGR